MGRDDAVAEKSKPVCPGVGRVVIVHPGGNPISHSTNAGFSREEVWPLDSDALPGADVSGAWRPVEWPSACVRSMGLPRAKVVGPFMPSLASGVAQVDTSPGRDFVLNPLCGRPFESRANGVAHARTAASVSVVPAWRPLSVEYAAAPLARESVAVAVGQVLPSVSSDGRFGPGRSPPLLEPARSAVAVGQQEDSASAVRRSSVRSTNGDGGASVATLGEGIEDARELARRAADVLPEDEPGLTLLDDAREVPEEAGLGAVESAPRAGEAEVLARASANDDVHQASKAGAVEGGNIRPNRAWSQRALLHAREKDCGGVGLSLDVGDGSDSANGSPRHSSELAKTRLKPKVEPAATGEQRESEEGRSHT